MKAIMLKTKRYKFGGVLFKGSIVNITDRSGVLTASYFCQPTIEYGVSKSDFKFLEDEKPS